MYLYEQAIIDDLNKLFVNGKVSALIADSLNEGFRRIAAKEQDKITLPAVVLTGGDWVINDSNFYSLMNGSHFKRDEEESIIKSSNIISITPSYNMYIIAQSSRECDMLTRELLFHYSVNPTLTIKIPYGIDKVHTFNLLFGNNVSKNQNPSGLVYRTLNFILQGAYLWHNNTIDIIKEVNVDTVEEYDNV